MLWKSCFSDSARMNGRLSFICLALVFCLDPSTAAFRQNKPEAPITGRPITTDSPETGKIWALLVAGSNTYENYHHQADVCHSYQVLHAHGIPDENIVVMMYDDIANNAQNPTKGIIINHPKGDDVYHGVLKDYTGENVTPENFINILTGNKEAMKNTGSGKVIESGPNDHVFVNFVAHGDTGILEFPNDVLTVKQLNDALTQMSQENRYSKLVMYVDACESGSMFHDILPNNISIFATTASDYDESAYACYYDLQRKTWLGDCYSVSWMEDSDKEDIETETLQDQYQTTKRLTATSHVMEYGDLSIGNNFVVGEFQGREQPPINRTTPTIPLERGVPSLEVPLDILYRELAAATTIQRKQQLHFELDEMIEKRAHVDTIVKKLVTRVAFSYEQEQQLLAARPQKLTQLDCHDTLVHAFNRHCFNLGRNPYALRYGYVLANMCENGVDARNVIGAMQQVCKAALNNDLRKVTHHILISNLTMVNCIVQNDDIIIFVTTYDQATF